MQTQLNSAVTTNAAIISTVCLSIRQFTGLAPNQTFTNIAQTDARSTGSLINGQQTTTVVCGVYAGGEGGGT